MNELSPGIRRSLPTGSGGAGWDGAGIRSAFCAWVTAERSPSMRPPRYVTAAVPAATPLATRKLRRCGAGVAGAAGLAGGPGWYRRCAVGGVPGDGELGSGVPGCGVPGRGVPGCEVPDSGVPGSGTGSGTLRTSRQSVRAAAAPPTSVAAAQLGAAVGRVSAAASPITVNAARPSIPFRSRRTAHLPMSAANSASTTRMPATRTVLSLLPKELIAKFFTGGGVESIDASPTATTGELAGATTPATSCPTPTATAPASSPASMPRPDRVRSTSGVTLLIRRGAPDGLPGGSFTSPRYVRPAGKPPKPAAGR